MSDYIPNEAAQNITAPTSLTVPVGQIHGRVGRLYVQIETTSGTVAHVLVLTSNSKTKWNQVAAFDLPDSENEFDPSVSGGVIECCAEWVGFAVTSITGTITSINYAWVER